MLPELHNVKWSPTPYHSIAAYIQQCELVLHFPAMKATNGIRRIKNNKLYVSRYRIAMIRHC